MPSSNTNQITKTDLDRIEASLKRVIEVAKTQKNHSELDEVVKALTDTLSQLKMTVEFDHEKRLAAIEEFLQNL